MNLFIGVSLHEISLLPKKTLQACWHREQKLEGSLEILYRKTLRRFFRTNYRTYLFCFSLWDITGKCSSLGNKNFTWGITVREQKLLLLLISLSVLLCLSAPCLYFFWRSSALFPASSLFNIQAVSEGVKFWLHWKAICWCCWLWMKLTDIVKSWAI